MNNNTAKTSTHNEQQWVLNHRQTWARKGLLRFYYESEYFQRIVAALKPGTSLEIGAGPGFFSSYHRCDVVSDITPAPHVDQVVDVHHMPFEDNSFDNVVGVDVIHHFFHPAKGLSEIVRCLRPGGRLVLIEPWTSAAGTLINKYIHNEDCFALDKPWEPVFTGSKNPMDGNATIPKELFFNHALELQKETGLRVVEVTPFSCFGFLATGGFTRFSAPEFLGRFIMKIEKHMPRWFWRAMAIKVFIVAEKV